MAVQTLKISGKQFVVIPKRDYDRMVQQLKSQAARDRGDVAEAKRRAKEPSVSIDELRRRVGL
jgi:hypothetical protein